MALSPSYNMGLTQYQPPFDDGNGLWSSQVLGPDGKPARLTKGQRQDALMGSYDSIFAKSFQFAGFSPDALISSKGYQTLDDYYHQQGAVGVPVDAVRKACLNKGISVRAYARSQSELPSPDAQEIANHLKYDLDTIIDPETGNHQDPRHVLQELLYALYMGFQVTEMIWERRRNGRYKGKWYVKEFAAKPARQIGFRLDKRTMKPVAITSYTPETGYQITPGIPIPKVVRYTYDGQYGLPFGWGGGRRAYKHIWTIDNMYRFWNIFCEVYATPSVLVKAPPGRAQNLAAAALALMRQGSTVALPDNCEAEFMQVAQAGKTFFNEVITHHIAQIAYIFLYSTLTTQQGADGAGSDGGQSKTHENTTEYPICFARADVEFVINAQYVRRWLLYNYDEDALDIAPRISLGAWDSVDMYNMTQGFQTLVNIGNMHPSNPDIRSRLNLSPITAEEQSKLDADKQEAMDLQKMGLTAKGKPGQAAGAQPKKPAKNPAKKGVSNTGSVRNASSNGGRGRR